jgi:transcriptional regulator GlxA family with amidase domain
LELEKLKGLERFFQFLRILQGLAKDGGSPLSSPGFSPSRRQLDQERIDKVVQHLESHVTEELPLARAAALASMSIPAFGRFFRRCTGKSWVAFVNEFRIGLACRLLIETSKNVSEICYESGFNNLSNFNRRFLALKGLNPASFRKEFSGK